MWHLHIEQKCFAEALCALYVCVLRTWTNMNVSCCGSAYVCLLSYLYINSSTEPAQPSYLLFMTCVYALCRLMYFCTRAHISTGTLMHGYIVGHQTSLYVHLCIVVNWQSWNGFARLWHVHTASQDICACVRASVVVCESTDSCTAAPHTSIELEMCCYGVTKAYNFKLNAHTEETCHCEMCVSVSGWERERERECVCVCVCVSACATHTIKLKCFNGKRGQDERNGHYAHCDDVFKRAFHVQCTNGNNPWWTLRKRLRNELVLGYDDLASAATKARIACTCIPHFCN